MYYDTFRWGFESFVVTAATVIATVVLRRAWDQTAEEAARTERNDSEEAGQNEETELTRLKTALPLR